jgi:transcriptional regulator with XRE-family HTH domain
MTTRRRTLIPTGRSGGSQATAWKAAFGTRLRTLRKERGLSQEALAHLAGVHRTYEGGVERGEYSISLTNIHEFAKALDVDVKDLF